MKTLGEIFLMIIIQLAFAWLGHTIGKAIDFPLMFTFGWFACMLYYYIIRENNAHS